MARLIDHLGAMGHSRPAFVGGFRGFHSAHAHAVAFQLVGRVLAALDELGLSEETLVIFATDRGAYVGSHCMQDKGPAMYADTCRVPLIARMPGSKARRCG